MNANKTKALPLLFGIVSLSAFEAVSQAQTSLPVATEMTRVLDYVCVERGPDSKVWQKTIVQTNADATVTTNFQLYTELATGISYLNNSGQYVDSVEEVDAIPGGAQAVQGRHKVDWKINANTPGGAVTTILPDGNQLSSTVVGLAYFDTASGSNAPIAYLQNCIGTISPPNQVVYANAFSNFNADLYYTYTKAGLSQDVVLRQSPPAPDTYGLSDETTLLQVYTEFFNSVEPVATAVTNGGAVDDAFLDFGGMTMTVGDTLFFDSHGDAINSGTVAKAWVHVNNRTFLIESIPFRSIFSQVAQLHPASTLKPNRASSRGVALLKSEPPRSNKSENSDVVMKVAKAVLGTQGFAVDYNLLSGTISNLTLQGDTTYLVSSAVNVTNILTIEGGAVIKYTNTGQINITGPGSNIVCQTGPYRPAVFTSVFDSSVGASIASGTITVQDTYINFTEIGTQPLTLRNLRFSYAATAVAGTVLNTSSTDWIKLWDCQFFDCGTGFGGTLNEPVNLYVYNVLFATMTNAISLSATNGTTQVTTQNVTADNMQYFTFNINGANVSAVNSIFTAVSHVPLLSITTNSAEYSSGTGVYTNVGGGSYYLINGSTNRNAGTTMGLDGGLIADLQSSTTYPPVILPTYVTASTNFYPTAPRNTGAPDYGYHYAPIDYAMNSVFSNIVVNVEPGTVLAGFGNCAVELWGTATFNCTGTAATPNYLVRYNTVQEQSKTNWEAPVWNACFIGETNGAAFEFTDWCVLGGDGLVTYWTATPWLLSLQNCQLYSGLFTLSGQTLSSSNCLYQRVATTLFEIGSQSVANTFFNNLLWNGSLWVKHSGTGTWTFRDNLFDQCNITNRIGGNISVCESNAYATNLISSPQYLPGDVNIVPLANSPAYQVGALGQFYYPSTQINLIHNGSQLASAAGLNYYTVTANNVADGTGQVSIGYHYAADGPIITSEPVSVTTTPGGSATFTVTATGQPPLVYQWYFNGVLISGATASSYSPTVTAGSAGNYGVIVSDPLGTTPSWIATLKVAQNDFYVNWWNSKTISPINSMIRGIVAQYFFMPPDANVMTQTMTNASLRGVQPGTDADTYNWMKLTSFGNSPFVNNYYQGNTNVTPTTTLQLLQAAGTNGESLIFTVNSRGDGHVTGTNWYQNPQTNAYLAVLASNWVRYANFIVQHYCWSNGFAVPYSNGTPALAGNDQYIVTNLSNYWVAGNGTLTSPTLILPTLLSYSNFTVLPKVKYWEIGNEVEGPLEPTNVFTNSTVFTAASYDATYTTIVSAMLGADPTIQVGPGFEGEAANDTLIDTVLSDPSAVINFVVHHPYPAQSGSLLQGYITSNDVPDLVGSVESVKFWQHDVTSLDMAYRLVESGLPANVPLFSTEWSGDGAQIEGSVVYSMWTMLADAETLLSMISGQQTMAACMYEPNPLMVTYGFGDVFGPAWPTNFMRFEADLGNVYLSSSDGDKIPAVYGPPGDGQGSLTGSCESPFRVYSTADTNTGLITVWLLNLTNSASQTVDLHFPGAIASGTLWTLGNTGIAPNLTNTNCYGGTNFMWLTSSVTWASGNSVVLTNLPATFMVGQFALTSTPVQPKAPVILSIPAVGRPGQIITIAGTNFSTNLLQNTVYFGPVRGVVEEATSDTLSVQVPYGAAYAPITVTVSNLTAYSTTFFNPAYYGETVSNPISLQAVRTNMFTNTMSSALFQNLSDMTYFDADGDGKGDLGFVGTLGITGIFEDTGTGPGSFVFSNTPYSLPIGDTPGGTCYGDFDGDGLLDWVVVVDDDMIVQIFRNASTPGNIFFGQENTYVTGRQPVDVKVVDFDGDGRPDIVVANYQDATVSVYRNLSTGPGNIAFAQKVDFPACPNAQFLAVGDFDGDGRADIAVTGYTTSTSNVVVLRNLSTSGTISFSSPVKVATLDGPWGIAAGDFNGDGKLDLAVAELPGGDFRICSNQSTVGNISFSVGSAITTGGSYQIAVGDLNGDGMPDVVTTDAGGGVSKMLAFQNLGGGSSFSSTSYTTGTGVPYGAGPICVIVADMDGDGRPDIAVGNFYATNVVIFQNTSQY